MAFGCPAAGLCLRFTYSPNPSIHGASSSVSMIDYNPRNWLRQILAFRGTVTPKIVWRVLFMIVWAVGVVLLHRHVRQIEVPATVHALIGVALGLLLVFRTNASYERYWEGRKAWERIMNDTRNVVRTARGLLSDQPALLEPLVRWAVTYPYSCMHALRNERGLGPGATQLSAKEVADTLAAENVPLEVAARISRLLAEQRPPGTFAERAVVAIDTILRSLVEALGTCERIRTTPIPFAYVVHLRRALFLYLLTLPFALVDPFGWSTIVYTTLISYILLGIDEIGVEIENPFGTDPNDLPLEELCATIERELTSFVKKPVA
jgi:putative membrane protein